MWEGITIFIFIELARTEEIFYPLRMTDHKLIRLLAIKMEFTNLIYLSHVSNKL